MEQKCLEFSKLSDEEAAAEAEIEAAAVVEAEELAPEEKDPEIAPLEKSTGTDSDSESSDPEPESDVDMDDDEHPEHKSLCCKCC